MKRNGTLIAGVVIVFLSAALFVAVKHQAKRKAQLRLVESQQAEASVPPREITTLREEPTPLVAVPAEGTNALLNITAQTVTNMPLNVTTQNVAQVKKTKAKKVIQDPLARDALALVGLDPDAEMYWFGAIHDQTLPKSERQDLIDDLNEEGLPDPKHPTLEDLPLIFSRLEILEDLVPSLTDEFDWKESYSDLLNLADLALGGGKPVH